MKRIISLILVIALILMGCTVRETPVSAEESESESTVETESAEVLYEWVEIQPEFDSLSDENLLTYVEDIAYREAVMALNSEEYFVENVSAVYISKEYLEEVAFNSQSNIYFGYTLAELDEIFQGSKYIFTLGEDGLTGVQELAAINDNTAETIIRDVAIGSGVILVCVTVSAVSAIAGAPAVSMIFATSAVTAKTFATSSAAIGGISAGIVRGIETGDFEEALEAAALGAAEGFKWGAISGAIIGGTSRGYALYGAAKQTNFTMNQYAQIQQETGYPLEIIKQFHSFDEYKVFKQAGSQAEMLGKELALVRRDIDLYNVFDEHGRNNFKRMYDGLNPIDIDGKPFEWHHIGQEDNATLALLTAAEHDSGALHGFKVVSEINRSSFATYKKTLNKELLNWLLKNE